MLFRSQMIAKGHDFPNVTLVGVVLADAALHIPDFRSAEKTFQLLTQVAGRSGRAEKPGKVLIQTFHPDHFSLQHTLAHAYEKFADEELQHREALLYPPFSRLAQLRFAGKTAATVEAAALQMKQFLAKLAGDKMKLLGPAPAPLAKIRGEYRYLMLVKSPGNKQLAWLLKNAQQHSLTLSKKVQMTIDIDPLQML